MYYFRSLGLLCLGGLIMVSVCGKGDGTKSNKSAHHRQDTTQRSSAQITTQTLLQASLVGKMDYIQKAVEQGVNIDKADPSGRTPLMLASYNGHSDLVRYLLKHDANPSAVDQQGRPPLIFSASGPYPETTKILLNNGADPNVTDGKEGWSALMWAAAEGNQQVVRVLLDHGADPSLQDKDGETAHDFAVNNGHTKVAELLEKAEQ